MTSYREGLLVCECAINKMDQLQNILFCWLMMIVNNFQIIKKEKNRKKLQTTLQNKTIGDL